MAALGLCCCVPAFSNCSERGLLFVVVCGLLIAVASLVAEHGLYVPSIGRRIFNHCTTREVLLSLIFIFLYVSCINKTGRK